MVSDLHRYCLATNAQVEALVNNWYASAYTIAPAPASLHLINYQLKVLRSYLTNPELHEAACSDKTLLGGPFVAIPADQASEVQLFYDYLTQTQRSTIAFAEALISFELLLATEGHGLSIEPFYSKLPPPLRGLCELGYDYRDHPVLRLLEPLVYRSPVARERRESFLLSPYVQDGTRPFSLSTPRLPRSGAYHWDVAFDDSRLDDFFQLETEPQPLGQIAELLGTSDKPERLLPLLSGQNSHIPASPSWREPRTRIRYFGHACLLIEHAGVSILTDPNISVLPSGEGIDRFSYLDLPSHIDIVLITHMHADHFIPEVITRLRRRIGTLIVPRSHGVFLGDPSLAIIARRLRIPVVEVDAYDEQPTGNGGRVIAVPFLGEHADLLHAKTGFLISIARDRILVAADSNCLDRTIYDNIRKEYGDVDVAFLGMECRGAPLRWQYGALLPNQVRQDINESRRLNGCNARAATAMLSALGVRKVFVYAMGREPWLEHLMALAPTADSVQMKEAQKLLASAPENGWVQCESLLGRSEIVL
jgi:L-ascorbate metabolism protein UlaG (beta-lactamase superfamily)